MLMQQHEMDAAVSLNKELLNIFTKVLYNYSIEAMSCICLCPVSIRYEEFGLRL